MTMRARVTRPHKTRSDVVRVWVYRRISADDRLRERGVDRQLDDCKRYVARVNDGDGMRPWQIVEVLTDNDISAALGNVRPDYLRLVAALESGQVDVILLQTLDRLYREPLELEQFLPLAQRHDVVVHCTDGEVIKPGEGALIPRIKTAVANEELRKIKWRTRQRKLADAEAGAKHGRVPYGWNPDGSARDGEAEHVMELTERLLAGDSLAAIARDWNARAVPTQQAMQRKMRDADGMYVRDESGAVKREPYNRAWDSNLLKVVARRWTNCGLREYVDRDGERVIVKGYYAPLVSEEQVRAVRALLDGRRRAAPMRRYLLGGLMECGGCGGRLSGVRRKDRADAYRCAACSKLSIPVAIAEEGVRRAIIDELSRADVAELIGSGRDDAARRAAEEAEALRGRRASIVSLIARGLIEQGEAEEGLRVLGAQLRAAEANADRLSHGRLSLLDGLIGENAEAEWDALPDERKRTVLRTLLTIVVVPRDKEHWRPQDRMVIAPADG